MTRIAPRRRRQLIRDPRPALAAALLLGATATAQSFSASAAGTLSAVAGSSSQSVGPAPLQPGNSSAFAQIQLPFFTTATVVADVAADQVYSTVAVSGAATPASATANLVITLAAPRGAGVRLTITHQENSQSLAHAAQVQVTVAGQTWTSNVTQTHVIDAIVPVGGLVVQFDHSGNGTSTSSLCTIAWDHPGVETAGGPTPGCLGPAVGWAFGIPEVGNAAFGFTCANTHPNVGGVVAIGLAGVSTPWVYGFVDIWLDPNLPIVTLYLPSNANGYVFHALPLPADPSYAGLELFGQWVLFEPPGCTPLDLSASNAVKVTVML